MTVRWKPLLVLSGLFVAVAVLGLTAIALNPTGAADLLAKGNEERAAGQFDRAKIQYQRALQAEPKNAAIHEEMAELYAEWADAAPAEKKAALRGERIGALAQAAKLDRRRIPPRRTLLADALGRDDPGDSTRWAKELAALDPKDATAAYVVAADALDENSPNMGEVRTLIEVVRRAKAPQPRVDWLDARVAQVAKDAAALEAVLSRGRDAALPAGADPIDRMALVRLRVVDIQACADPAALAGRVRAFQAEAKQAVEGGEVPSPRLTRLAQMIETVQRAVSRASAGDDAKAKAELAKLGDALEAVSETVFQKAARSPMGVDPTLTVSYADQLRFRQKREQCLKVVELGFASPLAKQAAFGEMMLRLHAIAAEAALSDAKDKDRFALAEPHIAELIASNSPTNQGIGHLFQGAIDLERSGLSGAAAGKADPAAAAGAPSATASQPKLRASALMHLKKSVELLPELAEAKARYGVALILTQEPALGRQHLQDALRLGELDANYQVWSAWSMVQAGYPEEAEPIIDRLLSQVKSGQKPRELEPTLHLLSGEIHQARRSPADLAKALSEYEKAFAAGQAPTPAVQLRLAQIDAILKRYDACLARIKALRGTGQAGASAEHLAVLTLQEMGKGDDARKVLAGARAHFPGSAELAGLDAALLARDGKKDEADRVLADFLRSDPENLGIVQLRAQYLAELLGKVDEARSLLKSAAARGENSAPLVQLAMLDLQRRDFKAVSETIASIRSRWAEAAAADLLDAQMALAKGDPAAASRAFQKALQKDPKNKVVQFWKAQLDSRSGAAAEAAKVIASIAEDKPSKELESGISLATAAESALAGLALQDGDFDSAIRRYTGLLRGDVGDMGRSIRWQLAAALSAKGQWPEARREVEAMVNDPKAPPSPEERVRAADLYRAHTEDAAARAQLDVVLKADPSHPGAVVTRASMLNGEKKPAEAAALVRRAIDLAAEPPPVFYLMLAALENLARPGPEGLAAAQSALDRGLARKPDSIELARAKFRVLELQGDRDGALAFIKGRAEADSKGPFRRQLADVYRERGDLASAEAVVKAIRVDEPDDARLAAAQVRLLAGQAVAASQRGDRGAERQLNDRTSQLLRELRSRFPGDLAFPQAEAELAARKGDMGRALEITKQMDAAGPNSPAGPLMRARIFEAQNRTREAADAYAQALDRNPRQNAVRVLLGNSRLRAGQVDEAIRQAQHVLDADKDSPDALILRARALASRKGPAEVNPDDLRQAERGLADAIKARPAVAEFYHALAEIRDRSGRRGDADAALRAGLKAVPGDDAGVAQLVESLASPRAPGRAAEPAKVAEAKALAESVAGGEAAAGTTCLAVAVGFHKAGQFEAAVPWAEKAAARLDRPAVHREYGDLLLSMGEATSEPATARGLYERAVAEYDKVLKADADSVEAVNNKAWILHSYLDQGPAALEIAKGLLKRVDPTTLPAEFFDTLGSIQEKLGQSKDAEGSFEMGLRKSPGQPALNFHMGRLVARDPNRVAKAAPYLRQARAGSADVPPAMRAEIEELLRKVEH